MPWGLSDIRKAISVQELAIRQAPKDSSGIAGIHNNLANSVLSRFERTGDLEDIAQAVSEHRVSLLMIVLTVLEDSTILGRRSNAASSEQDIWATSMRPSQ
ncbi:hypothetical protein NMY22_g15928 [Coprinellus aureogranulatus]|nr:hypothetical protein NMY22_g15928 [Coprinellus aureogranulatus]